MAVVVQQNNNTSTVVSQIITDAYRESNNIAIGQTPNPKEQEEGLVFFNRFLRSVFGNEAGDPLTPIAVGNNNVNTNGYFNLAIIPSGWYPPRNSRIVFNNTQAQTLTLNPYPEDGERIALIDASNNWSLYNVTVNGNGRLISGNTQAILNIDGDNKEYFYRGDIATWFNVSNLGLNDYFPFPTEFEDLFVIGLAMRINPRNKQEIDPQSIQAYKRLLSRFRARYDQTVEQRPEEALMRTPGIPYQYYRNYGPYTDTSQRFNTGYSN